MDELFGNLLIIGIGVAVILGVISLVAIPAYWIMHPLDRAAKNRRMPIQFTVADLLCLMVLLQFGAIPLAYMQDEVAQRHAWTATIFLWTSFGLIWAFGLVLLSRAGIVGFWQRSFFEALVIPLSLFGIIAFSASAVFLIVVMGGPNSSFADLALAVFGVVGLSIILFGCGLLTRWAVRTTSNTPE